MVCLTSRKWADENHAEISSDMATASRCDEGTTSVSAVQPYASLVNNLKSKIETKAHENNLPFITLTYAQSLDGSIAAKDGGAPLKLSSDLSMKMTHELRAFHDGILVGIGTVLADNPSLTTRLCEGPSPRPVILDSQLRCPPTAKFIQLRKGDPSKAPIIVYNRAKRVTERQGTSDTFEERKKELEATGVILMETSHLQNNVEDMFSLLKSEHNLKSIMVEGGGQVIRWFILSASHLVDAVLITVAPMFVGGLVPTQPWLEKRPHQRLKLSETAMIGGDVIVLGEFEIDAEQL